MITTIYYHKLVVMSIVTTIKIKKDWLYTKCWGEERAYKINLKNFQKK